MNLKVLLAAEVLVEVDVSKVIAEAHNGYFCLLPNHVDFVTALVPGILSFEISGGREEYLAVDEGILVKYGKEVSVSARNAVRGPDLGQLRRTVSEKFEAVGEHEKSARTAFLDETKTSSPHFTKMPASTARYSSRPPMISKDRIPGTRAVTKSTCFGKRHDRHNLG